MATIKNTLIQNNEAFNNLNNKIQEEIEGQLEIIENIIDTLEYKAAGEGSGSTTEQATPVISVNTSTGLITATAGDKSATQQLTTQGRTTITPKTTSQTAVTAGKYTTGAVTVSAIQTETLTATENKTYTPTSGKFFSSVTVNVANSGDSGGTGDGLPNVIVAGDTPILGSWVGSQVTATTATDTGLSVTIPQDGTYRFYIPATKGTAYGTTTNPTIQIYKNEVTAGDAIAITTTTPTQPYSIDLECSAGDVIKVYATAVKSSYTTTAVTVMALICCIDK